MGDCPSPPAGSSPLSNATLPSPRDIAQHGKDRTAPASDASPPLATSYEAESPSNTLAGGAVLQSCSACSGGEKAGFVGEGGTLTFNGITAPAAGTYNLTVVYCSGNERPGMVSVDGGAPQSLSYPSTGSFSTTGTMTIPVQLSAGDNTIEFSDPNAFTPDYDRIIVADSPS